MVEIRSETVNASNFAASPPTEFATGVHEDRNVSYPPLNYRYYRNTLTAKADHWERPCLEPVKVGSIKNGIIKTTCIKTNVLLSLFFVGT